MKNDALVNAIFYLIQTCRSLEDDIEETASFLAEEARIDYDEFEDDVDATISEALDILINDRAAVLPEFLNYYFTEDYLLDFIIEDLAANDQMENNLQIIYNALGNFPGGNQVKSNIKTNVFDFIDTYALDAAKVGYEIGHEYWKYITNPVYGVRTNDVFAVGHMITDGKYVYSFGQDISNYYYRDAYLDVQHLPQFVGYEFRFREDGDDVVVDIYPFAINLEPTNSHGTTYTYADKPIDYIVISDFSADAISTTAQTIAQWLDEYAMDAISYWVE